MNKMCRTNIQSGRSMIEMLGVLAIIGVLSVGGIAGYSKAMMKFKINKTIDQITQISQNVRTLYARQKSYKNISNKIIKKANVAPNEIFEGSGSDYAMTNAFGGEIKITSSSKNIFGDNGAFLITYTNIPDEACIELATQDWGNTNSSGLLIIGIADVMAEGGGSISSDLCAGEGFKSGNNVYARPCAYSLPFPINVAVELCSGNNNPISWRFF